MLGRDPSFLEDLGAELRRVEDPLTNFGHILEPDFVLDSRGVTEERFEQLVI